MLSLTKVSTGQEPKGRRWNGCPQPFGWIAKVKEQVEQFVAMAEFNQKRAEQGGIVEDTTLHSLSRKSWYRKDHRGPHFG